MKHETLIATPTGSVRIVQSQMMNKGDGWGQVNDDSQGRLCKVPWTRKWIGTSDIVNSAGNGNMPFRLLFPRIIIDLSDLLWLIFIQLENET